MSYQDGLTTHLTHDDAEWLAAIATVNKRLDALEELMDIIGKYLEADERRFGCLMGVLEEMNPGLRDDSPTH